MIISFFAFPFLLYFSYSFLGKELGIKNKILFIIPLIFSFMFINSDYNVYLADTVTCEIKNGLIYIYLYSVTFIYLFWTIKNFISFYKRKDANKRKKNQIKIIIGAIVFFVVWTFGFLIASTLWMQWNLPNGEKVDLFSPFGMVVFIGMLAYAITKYQFLNIKVIASAVLIVAAWLLVFSQLFISNQSLTNHILTGLTLAFTTVLGWMLYKGIKIDIKLGKELDIESRKLAGLNTKLEELDRAKSEFISIASHQLRTPLTSVKGFTSLILDNTFGKIPDRQKTAVEKVFVNNEKLVLLVEDMLNVSRLEAGRLEYEFAEVNVSDIVSATVEIAQLYAKNRKLKLTLNRPKEKLLAIVDQRKVSEIISNLIDNAIKYTPSGSVTVTVEKFRSSEKVGEFKNTQNASGN